MGSFLLILAVVATASNPRRPPPPPPPPPVVYGFRFATTHSDGMVLQAAPQQSIVWGFSKGPVKVCWSPAADANAGTVGTNSTCVDSVLTPGPAGSNGSNIFTATLPPVPPSSKPFDITATTVPTEALSADTRSKEQSVYLRGVLFGDVFVCSGQSK